MIKNLLDHLKAAFLLLTLINIGANVLIYSEIKNAPVAIGFLMLIQIILFLFYALLVFLKSWILPEFGELKSLNQKLLDSFLKQKKPIPNSNLNKINLYYDKVDSLISIYNFIKPKHILPTFNNWRISTDSMIIIVEEFSQKKGTAVDIGSGVSTIVLGYVAKQNGNGSKVISIEHDVDYFEKTKKMIENHDLQDYIDLQLCPLKNGKFNVNEFKWFDLENVIFPESIEILLVDGPPGIIQKNSRYPAVPALSSYLTSKSAVFLDDGARKEEQIIAELWETEYNLKKEYFTTEKGLIRLNKKYK